MEKSVILVAAYLFLTGLTACGGGDGASGTALTSAATAVTATASTVAATTTTTTTTATTTTTTATTTREETEAADAARTTAGIDAGAADVAIAFGRYYYWDGDSGRDSFYFYDDNTFDYDSREAAPETGTWSLDGNRLTVTVDGESIEMTVESDGEVIVSSDGARLVLEGADAAVVSTSEFYYLNGEIGGATWFFFIDGYVDYDSGGETVEGTYVIKDDKIIVTGSDGGTLATLTIIDENTVEDSANGRTYSLLG